MTLKSNILKETYRGIVKTETAKYIKQRLFPRKYYRPSPSQSPSSKSLVLAPKHAWHSIFLILSDRAFQRQKI
ncbi:hypothetical protein J6590_103130 [Homalodisca vitripennis]|nr:hypothetical protein J6590_103130 [Homalodisca vitripennis]